MSDRANQLVQEVLALSSEERDEVVRELWERQEEELPPYPDGDEDAEQAELERRLESLANGTADPIPWDVAREQIRAELARRRAIRQNTQP